MHEQYNDIAKLPQSLVDDLKARDRGVTLLTASVDREIEAMASAQFGARQARSRALRPAWVAVAAAVLVAFLFTVSNFDALQEPEPLFADLDKSGRIDIADVLALARQRDPDHVSQAELDAFAMRVVSLANWEDAS